MKTATVSINGTSQTCLVTFDPKVFSLAGEELDHHSEKIVFRRVISYIQSSNPDLLTAYHVSRILKTPEGKIKILVNDVFSINVWEFSSHFPINNEVAISWGETSSKGFVGSEYQIGNNLASFLKTFDESHKKTHRIIIPPNFSQNPLYLPCDLHLILAIDNVEKDVPTLKLLQEKYNNSIPLYVEQIAALQKKEQHQPLKDYLSLCIEKLHAASYLKSYEEVQEKINFYFEHAKRQENDIAQSQNDLNYFKKQFAWFIYIVASKYYVHIQESNKNKPKLLEQEINKFNAIFKGYTEIQSDRSMSPIEVLYVTMLAQTFLEIQSNANNLIGKFNTSVPLFNCSTKQNIFRNTYMQLKTGLDKCMNFKFKFINSDAIDVISWHPRLPDAEVQLKEYKKSVQENLQLIAIGIEQKKVVKLNELNFEIESLNSTYNKCIRDYQKKVKIYTLYDEIDACKKTSEHVLLQLENSYKTILTQYECYKNDNREHDTQDENFQKDLENIKQAIDKEIVLFNKMLSKIEQLKSRDSLPKYKILCDKTQVLACKLVTLQNLLSDINKLGNDLAYKITANSIKIVAQPTSASVVITDATLNKIKLNLHNDLALEHKRLQELKDKNEIGQDKLERRMHAIDQVILGVTENIIQAQRRLNEKAEHSEKYNLFKDKIIGECKLCTRNMIVSQLLDKPDLVEDRVWGSKLAKVLINTLRVVAIVPMIYSYMMHKPILVSLKTQFAQNVNNIASTLSR